jgi:hypothetical protein
MTTTDILTSQRDSLRDMTRHADSKASLLLIAPGAALTTMGTVAALTGAAAILATIALVLAVAVIPVIAAAIWPRRPRNALQSVEEIVTAAELAADDEFRAADQLGEEIHRLQRIMRVKWAWTRIALALTVAAVALASIAAVAS